VDFFGINGWEFLVLLLLAMFIFGPDRLPKAISDGVRMIRNLRDMARNATTDLSRELGTEIALEDLNPKTLLRKHILSEEDERLLRKPMEELAQEIRSDARNTRGELHNVARDVDIRFKPVNPGGPANVLPTQAVPAPYVFDDDAT
jgi:sec-independent protein translocase protein TatB